MVSIHQYRYSYLQAFDDGHVGCWNIPVAWTERLTSQRCTSEIQGAEWNIPTQSFMVIIIMNYTLIMKYTPNQSWNIHQIDKHGSSFIMDLNRKHLFGARNPPFFHGLGCFVWSLFQFSIAVTAFKFGACDPEVLLALRIWIWPGLGWLELNIPSRF